MKSDDSMMILRSTLLLSFRNPMRKDKVKSGKRRNLRVAKWPNPRPKPMKKWKPYKDT